MTDFTLPELGENVAAGDVLRILVKPGDTVAKDQPVLELETDKATIEVPSSVEGQVKEVKVKVGEKVKVGQAILSVEGGAAAPSKPAAKAEPARAAAAPAPAPEPKASPESEPEPEPEPERQPQAQPARPTPVRAEAPKPAPQENKVVDINRGARAAAADAGAAAPETPPAPAAPSVRRMARELGVDINQIAGSGESGRISVDDVKAHAKRLVTAAARGGAAAAEPLPDFSRWGDTERQPMRAVRRKTAEHLSAAWATIPHVTQFDLADITALDELRKKYAKQAEDAGGNLTVTAIAVKICAAALRRFPQFNASIDMASGEIVTKKYVNIGIAVDTDRGLLVPVIRNADQKNIVQIAVELSQLSEKARTRKIAVEEMQGGCFSISNLGGIGGTYFTPIVNAPEVAILGISRASMQPRFVNGSGAANGEFAPRLMLPLSLSYDHRVVDGADGIRFLRWVAEALEQPFLLALQGMITTQVVVVGGGPGGYAAAFLAADLGLSTTLIDPEVNPGGVCVYRGCIPSKALLHVAKVIDESRRAKAWGIGFNEPTIDLARLREFKNNVVKRLTNGTGQLAKHRKVRYLQGWAEIVDAHNLRVQLINDPGNNVERVQFEHAILATGSLPAIPPSLKIDDPRVMDSTAALDLPDIPKSLLVVGGGYIGLELGTVYATLGSAVTVVEMTAGLLPGADRDLVDVLAKRVGETMKQVLLETKVVEMVPEADGIRVRFEGKDVAGGNSQKFDRVLVSVGRRPNSKIPGLDRTHVQVDQRGFIMVDEQRRTHEPSIFAIGDVVGEPMLAHKASHEGRVAVEVMAGENVAFAPRAIPAVVFTDPELAWAGLTQSQAEKEGRRVAIAKFPWGASGRAITLDRLDGLTKLILDAETERILGVGLVGAGAGELIAEGVLAIEMGANATDLKLSIHPHPTLTETMMESAEVFFGQATHVYRPKRG